jgi:diadenosine tetraphosphate (Ap4A) HIT family hydrolase
VPEVRRHIGAHHHPHGYNIGINIGEAAGQTVGHARLHVIPRYRGDVKDPRGGIRWIIPGKARYWQGA